MDKKEEYKANGWVARDGKGVLDEEGLYFHTNEPNFAKNTGLWISEEPYWQLPTEWFPDVIAERDCIPVKLKLTIEEVGK